MKRRFKIISSAILLLGILLIGSLIWKNANSAVPLRMDLEDGYLDKPGGFTLFCTNQGTENMAVLPDSIRIERRQGFRWKETSIQMDASGLVRTDYEFVPGDIRYVYVFKYYPVEEYPQLKNLENGWYRFCCTAVVNEKKYELSRSFRIQINPMTKKKLKERPSVLDTELYPETDVELKVCKINPEYRSCTFRIENHSDKTIQIVVGRCGMLDYLIDGQWYQVYGEMAVTGQTSRMIELQPGAELEQEVMSLCYDNSQAPLLPGSYRILAEIRVDGQSYHLEDAIQIADE